MYSYSIDIEDHKRLKSSLKCNDVIIYKKNELILQNINDTLVLPPVLTNIIYDYTHDVHTIDVSPLININVYSRYWINFNISSTSCSIWNIELGDRYILTTEIKKDTDMDMALLTFFNYYMWNTYGVRNYLNIDQHEEMYVTNYDYNNNQNAQQVTYYQNPNSKENYLAHVTNDDDKSISDLIIHRIDDPESLEEMICIMSCIYNVIKNLILK